MLANIYALSGQNELAIKEFKNAAKYARSSDSFGDGVAEKYEQAIKILQNPIEFEPGQLETFAGCYISESGSMFRFDTKEGSLVGSRENWSDFKLFADSPNTFFTRVEPKLALQFEGESVNITAYGAIYAYEKQLCH